MKNSKLIDILSKFSIAEIEQLKTFTTSPYFIKQKSLVDFTDIILKEHPQFKEENITENIVYQKLFPEQKFRHQTIQDLMTLLVTSIHRFLAVQNFLHDELDEKLRLMEELRKKDLGKEFLRVGTILQKKLETGKRDDKYYFNLMKYEEELGQFYTSAKGHPNYSQYVQNKSDALDHYFLASKLKLACDMINEQNVSATKNKISLLDEILKYVSSNLNKFENIPAVIIYYRIILTLTIPDNDKYFYSLKTELENAFNNFSNRELRDMYGFAQNYCIKKLNSGKMEYGIELINLYRKLLETGIIFENGYLSQWDYKNIVSIGLRLKEYNWVEKFIGENKNLILPNFREIAYSFNMSNFYYEKKDFKSTLKMLGIFNEALNLIDDPDFDDTFYNLDSRSLLLKVYYQLNDDEPFLATFRAFKLFLERNKKISERHRIIYLNLLKYTKKLSDIRSKISFRPEKELRNSFKKLKNKISSEKDIVNPAWLKTQVDELENEINNGGRNRI